MRVLCDVDGWVFSTKYFHNTWYLSIRFKIKKQTLSRGHLSTVNYNH